MKRNDRKRCERGVILPVLAVGMLSLVFAAGLAVDISHFYTVGTELQNAADAAALAGASALNHTGPGITTATDRAVAVMNQYEINDNNVVISRSDVRFAVNLSDFDTGTGMSEGAATANPQNIRFVKVNITPKSVLTTFTSAILGNSLNIARSAVAGQSVGINNFNYFTKLVLVQDNDPERVANDTNQKLDVFGTCPNDDYYTANCTYNIHLAPPCDAAASRYEVIKQTNGNFSASEVNKQVICPVDTAGGVASCSAGGQEYVIDSHIDARAVRQAFNTFFNVYSGGMTAANFPPDKDVTQNITYAQYKSNASANAGNSGMMDRRVIVLPIMDLDDVTNWDPNDFRVNVDKFGVFFVVKRPTGNNSSTADLRVEYIGDSVVVGGGGFNPNLCQSNPNPQVTVPVLYR
jgi:Flp pilus assembly protein TadG